MAKIVLDQFDRRIIAELQKDARITNVALAEKIGLSPPPCLRRVKRLEDEGVIRAWRVELDRKVLADMAMHEGETFGAIIAQAKAALPEDARVAA